MRLDHFFVRAGACHVPLPATTNGELPFSAPRGTGGPRELQMPGRSAQPPPGGPESAPASWAPATGEGPPRCALHQTNRRAALPQKPCAARLGPVARPAMPQRSPSSSAGHGCPAAPWPPVYAPSGVQAIQITHLRCERPPPGTEQMEHSGRGNCVLAGRSGSAMWGERQREPRSGSWGAEYPNKDVQVSASDTRNRSNSPFPGFLSHTLPFFISRLSRQWEKNLYMYFIVRMLQIFSSSSENGTRHALVSGNICTIFLSFGRDAARKASFN